MSAIKFFTVLLTFSSLIFYGQESKYPKDTIYILFDKEKHVKKILKHPKLGKNLYFKNIGVYYNYKQKADTLCLSHLDNYKTLNIKELREKEIDWVNRKFKNQKYKPYSGTRNAVFITYLIEILKKEEKFVIYPVIWGRGYDDY